MRPRVGLFLLRNRWLIGGLILAGVVLYLNNGWPGLLALPFLLVAVLGIYLLFGWL